MKIKKWEIALLAAIVITFLCGFTLNTNQKELADKLIRLHVIANSDSAEDQSLKLDVRDAVLKKLETALSGIEDRSAAVCVIEENIESVASAAKKEILRQGYGYCVTAEICYEMYPTRDYETFSLPAGEYMSLKLTIGEGSGQNWWCVVFPPICSAPSIEADSAVMNLTQDEVALITGENTGYVVKFKAMELFQKIKDIFK